MNNWEQERLLQTEFGNTQPEHIERLTKHREVNFKPNRISLNRNSKNLVNNEDGKEIGYMNLIRQLIDQKQKIVVVKADGEVIVGVIQRADAETISLNCPLDVEGSDDSKYRVRVLFKHQIAEFSPTRGIEDFVDELVKNSKKD